MSQDRYLLTPEQERLWIEWKLYPFSATYNNYLVYQIKGKLDVERLILSVKKAAVDDIFHMAFTEEQGVVYQCIVEQPEINVTYIELSTQPMNQRYINAAIKTPFDLKKPFPYRFFITRQLDKDVYYLVLIMHHILMDGRSTALFLEKIAHHYNDIPLSHPSMLDFTDYLSELSPTFKADQTQTRDYWKTNVQAGLPSLAILHQPILANKISRRHRFFLPQTTKKIVQSFAFQTKSTLFLLLMAAFNILMYRYFGCKHLTLFYPVDIRPLRYKQVMGFFVNTLPMITPLEDHLSCVDVLETLTQQRKKDKKQQTISLAQVFNLVRSAGYSVKSHDYITFAKSNFLEKQLILNEVVVQAVTADFYHESMGHLSFFYDDANEGIDFSMEYNPTCFQPAFIEQLAHHFERLLTVMVENPKQPIASLAFMDAIATEPTVSVVPNELGPCRFIPKIIEKYAQDTPSQTAIREGEIAIDYAQFNGQANQLARYLAKKGVRKGDFVGVLVDRNYDTLVVLLAILKLGAAYVPIDSRYPQQRQNTILQDSGCQSFFMPNLTCHPSSVHDNLLLFSQTDMATAWRTEKIDNLPIDQVPNDVMYVIYTSGTTGKPKGIPITYSNLSSLFNATESVFRFHANDVWTLFHSLAFDFSVWEWCGALWYGGKLVIVPYAISRDPLAFYRLVVNEKVTVLNQTPSAFNSFIDVDQNKADALALRYVIFGGEKLEASHLSKWLSTHGENSPELINMYGITEGTIHVTSHKVTQNEINTQESLIGQPLPHMKIYVFNENQQPMPPGCPGELYIAGLGITAGYLNRVDETKQRFIPNPYATHASFQTLYRTGDQVKTLPTGDLVYLGRLDTQVNFKGFRIERGEIEYQLNQCPYVKRSVVNIRNDNTALSELAAYVVLETQAHPTPFVLREWLLQVLPPHMIPTKFFRITDIPLTIHGKIDYPALASLEQDALVNPALSQTIQSITARVSEIWKNTLHRQTIDPHQNFFDVGGDSLLLLHMQSELEAAFDRELPTSVLFSYPTIASLAEYLSEKELSRDAHPSPHAAQLRAEKRRRALHQRQTEKS